MTADNASLQEAELETQRLCSQLECDTWSSPEELGRRNWRLFILRSTTGSAGTKMKSARTSHDPQCRCICHADHDAASLHPRAYLSGTSRRPWQLPRPGSWSARHLPGPTERACSVICRRSHQRGTALDYYRAAAYADMQHYQLHNEHQSLKSKHLAIAPVDLLSLAAHDCLRHVDSRATCMCSDSENSRTYCTGY